MFTGKIKKSVHLCACVTGIAWVLFSPLTVFSFLPLSVAPSRFFKAPSLKGILNQSPRKPDLSVSVRSVCSCQPYMIVTLL